MESLEAIEQLGIVQLLKTSFIAYPIVNAMHIAAIGALLTSVVLLDLSLLGKIPSLPRIAAAALFQRIALVAFCVSALTGIALFSVKASDYAAMPVFLVKLGLIALAAVNLVFFLTLKRRGAGNAVLKISVVASILLWSGVLLCGRFIGFL